MTRINIVPPNMLTNQHLLAEYKELPRIFTAVRKLYDSGKTVDDVRGIPSEYVLGTGHCKFFYDKIYWLQGRYIDIYQELNKRGFNLDTGKFYSICDDARKLINTTGLVRGYIPSPEEVYKNMYRLSVRHFKTDDVIFEKE